MDYKDTLHLPQTDFPMKADLPKREPGFIKEWEDKKIYEKLIEKNKGRTPFILHDGPPYANGHIHFGHILNKTLKDIIIKYKNMSGFYSPYVPGWDCHGLPIELGAVKELQVKEKDPDKIKNPLVRREACRNYANKYVDDQKEQFKRLGIFGDWDHPYLTLTNQYEADIAREFLDLYLKGYVYEGKKPVYWCLSCRTALAEAEVEYDNITSPSIYVRFKIKDASLLQLEDSNKAAYFVIWTTTPWTLPANLALAIGDEFNYTILELEDGYYLVAQDLRDAFLKLIDAESNYFEVSQVLGSDLSRMKLVCEHPFMNRLSPVFPGSHVTLEAGTGIVHIAPGHGQEDYEFGQKYQLETLCPIDDAGRYLKGSLSASPHEAIRGLEGLNIKEANPLIVAFLKEQGILLNQVGDSVTHSFPHCWRCKKPVIFRATEQWFCSLSHNDLRKKTLRTINSDVKWIPSWGHDRIFGMIENRPDWCLSRQRIWGVPIIVHKCKDCGQNLLNEKTGQYIVESFEKHGADAWWANDKPLLPEGTKCSCGSQDFSKERSILDVWFDSGVSHAAVLERRAELTSPADLYLEGSDQHRGWFHSSLLTSMATRGVPPYKAVLTHGFVVDGEGRKYSKSAKNYVPPDKILGELGAELLRLWVAAEDYRNDIRVSSEIIKVLAEIYRKIRNTCRFMLGNLADFNPDSDYIPYEKRTELDLYALSLLTQIHKRVLNAFENYEFHVVHHTLNRFFTVELSAMYLDILKDRLYCGAKTGILRRSAQSTLYDILCCVTPLMSPILSFTSDEIWKFIPKKNSDPDSVFLAQIPAVNESRFNGEILERWERIGLIRDEILKALEILRQKKEIAHSLDARVIISAEGETLDFIKKYQSDWTQILIVSQVEIRENLPQATHESQVVKGLRVLIEKARGSKCARCWNYSENLGTHAEHPQLCERCSDVVVNHS